MSTNKTTHLSLHQWAQTDPIHRTEFNENFEKIDQEIEARTPRFETGRYTGNGASGRTITLPFIPKLLILLGYSGSGNNIYGSISLLTQDISYYSSTTGVGNNTQYIALKDDKLQLINAYWHNVSGKTEYYIAIR